jgi:hypothetical protein
VSHGEDRVNDALNGYLKNKDPEYRQMRARYDLLEPAWQNLGRTLEHAQRASSAVDVTEAAILARNAIKMNEPPETIQVTVTDRDSRGNVTGSHTETQSNPAHSTWAAQVAIAQLAASTAGAVAESRLADVNSDLAALNPSLAALGNPNRVGRVDDTIYAYFGGLFRLGPWSYDMSQADQIRHQLGSLGREVSRIQGGLEPEHTANHQWVWGKINGERAGLLQPGLLQPEAGAPIATSSW